MHISKFQLFNYKSFQDSGLLEFTQGINIIVGQNNAGKTALLEALTLNFSDVPHRSIKTLPTQSSITKEISKSEITLLLQNQELRNFLDYLESSLGIPYPNYDQECEYGWEGTPENIDALVKSYFQKILDSQDLIEINLSLSSINNQIIVEDDKISKRLNFNLYLPKMKKDKVKYDFIKIKKENGYSYSPEFIYEKVLDPYYGDTWETSHVEIYEGGNEETITYKLFQLFKSRIYRFYAERLNISKCAFGNKSILEPNASNLAEVLSGLQSRNSTAFDRYNKYINQIFPHIKRIAIEPREHNQLEIMVWNIEPETEREDLAVSLSSCGTGIGQVLAILYVVMNSPEPRTIIIDEPQSFLHPGAAKKLIEILKQFPQHQYFIATHSPTIINAANPSKIIMLKYEDCETKVSAINAKEAREQRSLLAEVGVSLSDVFGADNILWVEGPTEQICFPLILEKVAKKSLLGTTILAVQDVGRLDNKSKNASLIFDIYDKLSGGSSLFPPAIGFLFDRETRSDNEEKDLQERSKKLVTLLPRRMYENYLLHSEAITAIINECDENREEKLTIEEVKEWIDKNKYELDYFPKDVKIQGISDNDWRCTVDGAKLIKELFAHFCETRLRFYKTTHSVKLTEWLIDNQPEQLLEIAGLLVNILDFKD
ncbi:AAA family ATPase [Aphanizomenon flos-aquae NRERC-008]|jgi:AAA15 family ATPase/GTPase|uniref:Chromosome segregation protein SMC n=2 Tax=Aphanizomenon flos-aquae TaxID=1176 RepID=A0A1B7X3U8_APHFL|nr:MULTISPECIES: AAA family ATPase [Aphanizomenon]OBQ21748.1 MAG: chromosome segregation protein SMC [Anabaena sp. WA113]OBQ44032.1 MAG: chromosome segregation protein SMC [Aphanizomenon flos-aquae WA102]MBD2391834.1 AAA family ATPase [Aphanizomenon flos-aquae FACHB-1171]MBD2558292.1 AAA family ATPase [Aphanizomenon flos-aquae FACHB-1290]MBD2630968.1 AAA family ATPase [Aphanizomenon sp. FACHB-1399]